MDWALFLFLPTDTMWPLGSGFDSSVLHVWYATICICSLTDTNVGVLPHPHHRNKHQQLQYSNTAQSYWQCSAYRVWLCGTLVYIFSISSWAGPYFHSCLWNDVIEYHANTIWPQNSWLCPIILQCLEESHHTQTTSTTCTLTSHTYPYLLVAITITKDESQN